jgi:DNA-binding response OmpR family regulator
MATATGNKIMVVEDDAAMQSLLRTLLEIEGFQVLVAPDRKQLEDIVQAIHDAQPDILLLDVHLRNISGLDVVRGVRADADTRGARVIMSSGMDVKERCLEAGADDFLLKPYMPDDLINKLRG